MKRSQRWAAGLALSLALAGCSGAEVGRWAFHRFLGSQVHVQVPAALDFPDTVVLELGQDDTAAGRVGGLLAGALLGGSVEAKVGKAVKAAALPLRQKAAQSLQKQVVDAALFGVVDTMKGDVSLGWGVGRWGLQKDAAGKLQPVLDLEATLSVPGLGVVWRGSKGAADLGQAVKERAAKLDLAALALRPKAFEEVLDACVQDLGGQLLADLAKRRDGMTN